MRGIVRVTSVMALLLVGGILFASTAHADRFSSTNFVIDSSVTGNSVGGIQSSTNYTLTSAGGESAIGSASGGSYILGEGYVAQLQQSLQLNVQPNGLELHLPFDENAGNVAYDSSKNVNDGTLGGSIAKPTWTGTGKVGGALNFSESNGSYVSVADNASYKPSNQMTVETWYKPITVTSTNPRPVLSTKEASGYALTVLGSSVPSHCAISTICFKFYSSGAYRYVEASNSYLTNNTWAHIAATYDGSNIKLYVNGVERGSTAHTGTIVNGTPPLCVGSEAGAATCTTGDYADGAIDEVKIFSRALTAAEVKAEYDGQNAGNTAGVAFPAITPGTSQTTSFDSIVQTDAQGYTLAINQNQNLTSGGNSISPVSGSIASPVAWSEGSTKGLGFTMYGTNATAISGLWTSGSSYAALPASATSFYTRTGLTGGAKDVHNMRLRLDTNTSQASGNYTNQMTITGTFVP